jgi:hypothetical protein
MIRIFPGDPLQVSSNGKFYYTLALDKIRLFGGQLVFAFYQTSDKPLSAEQVLANPSEGFFETVDFIRAKREKRLERISKNLNTADWNNRVIFFKQSFAIKEKAKEWWICDREHRKIKRTSILSDEEKRYPLSHCIGDIRMVKLIEQRWSPEKDPRI